jgi:hypothetical protein
MIPLTRIGLLLVTLFTLLIGLLRLQPANSAVQRTFGRCALPCWQGITPGETRGATLPPQINGLIVPDCFAAAKANCVAVFPIVAHQPNSYVQIRAIDGVVDEILMQYPDITLGDVLLGFDQVQYTIYNLNLSNRSRFPRRFYVWLRTAGTQVSAIAEITCPASFYDLVQTRVGAIILQPLATGNHSPGTFGGIHRALGKLCRS